MRARQFREGFAVAPGKKRRDRSRNRRTPRGAAGFLLRPGRRTTARMRPRRRSARTQTNRARRSSHRNARSSRSNLATHSRIRRARTRVARRMHAGCAAERGNDEAGIVGEDRTGRAQAAVVQRLAGGVFGEGGRGFLERRKFGESAEARVDVEREVVGAARARARYSRSLPGFEEADQQAKRGARTRRARLAGVGTEA